MEHTTPATKSKTNKMARRKGKPRKIDSFGCGSTERMVSTTEAWLKTMIKGSRL